VSSNTGCGIALSTNNVVLSQRLLGGPSPSIRSAADVGYRSENRSLSREEGFKSLHFMGIDDSGQHEHRQLANKSRELLLVGPF
jgi:hypothetical protein